MSPATVSTSSGYKRFVSSPLTYRFYLHQLINYLRFLMSLLTVERLFSPPSLKCELINAILRNLFRVTRLDYPDMAHLPRSLVSAKMSKKVALEGNRGIEN